MTAKFELKSFSVGGATKEYDAGWEQTFRCQCRGAKDDKPTLDGHGRCSACGRLREGQRSA